MRYLHHNEQRELSNLNMAYIPTDGGPPSPYNGHGVRVLNDFGVSDQAEVRIVFRDLQQELIRLIEDVRYPVVMGCVAWLTEGGILAALARKQGVALIVQKEDFLRPDMDRSPGWKGRLAEMYGQLHGLCRYDMHYPLNAASVAGDPNFEPVRCVGFAPRTGGARPNMHHKFLVFCERAAGEGRWAPDYVHTPRLVWTGSFNFTANSRRSLENAVVIESDAIAEAYAREFAQVAMLSEPLDWESEWVAPEWRIGT